MKSKILYIGIVAIVIISALSGCIQETSEIRTPDEAPQPSVTSTSTPSLTPSPTSKDTDMKANVTTQNQSKEYVVINASLGIEEAKGVYSIPSGSIIYRSADGITTVYTPDGKTILKARDSDAAMIGTPHGTLVPATHIIQSPSGSFTSSEPFEFYTEDRGWISTESATKIYDAPDGTLILTVIRERSRISEKE